jgi:hypothetical protein
LSKDGFSYRSLDFAIKNEYSEYIRGNMQKKEEWK